MKEIGVFGAGPFETVGACGWLIARFVDAVAANVAAVRATPDVVNAALLLD